MSTTEPDDDGSRTAPAIAPVPFLKRVKIRNYKSIVNCDVELGAFTVLVGRNGSGKSNFLDASRFVADALRTSLGQAIQSRGGIHEICTRGAANPREFSIELDVKIFHDLSAQYKFSIREKEVNNFEVEWEYFMGKGPNGAVWTSFERKKDQVIISNIGADERAIPPMITFLLKDSLYIYYSKGLGNQIIDSFNYKMYLLEFYNLDSRRIRSLELPHSGDALTPDASNIAAVFGRIERERPEVKNRIIEYLQAVVPGVTDIKRVSLGPYETLEFTRTEPGSSTPTVFYPLNMSDGTLRAFGALVAVNQLAEGNFPVSLVGIEEPETALHPAAAGALMGALHEASAHTQIVLTTHSPDLLDRLDLETDKILVVESHGGETRIGPIDNASRKVIKEQLYSPGELLRMDQLEIDRRDLERQSKSDEASG